MIASPAPPPSARSHRPKRRPCRRATLSPSEWAPSPFPHGNPLPCHRTSRRGPAKCTSQAQEPGTPLANNQHRVNPPQQPPCRVPRQDASLSQTRLLAGPIPGPRRDQRYTQISMISAARPLPGFLPRRNRTAQRKNGAAAGQTLFPFFGRGKTAATTAFFLEAYLCQTQVRGRSTADRRPASSDRCSRESLVPQPTATSPGDDRNAASAIRAPVRRRQLQAGPLAALGGAKANTTEQTHLSHLRLASGPNARHRQDSIDSPADPAKHSPPSWAAADPPPEAHPRGQVDRDPKPDPPNPAQLTPGNRWRPRNRSDGAAAIEQGGPSRRERQQEAKTLAIKTQGSRDLRNARRTPKKGLISLTQDQLMVSGFVPIENHGSAWRACAPRPSPSGPVQARRSGGRAANGSTDNICELRVVRG
jgi:hypothetical protein